MLTDAPSACTQAYKNLPTPPSEEELDIGTTRIARLEAELEAVKEKLKALEKNE